MKSLFSIVIILIFLILNHSNGISQINLHWNERFNGSANYYDEGRSIVTDNSGNIYVTGFSYSLGSFEDFTTIKYNSAGVSQWTALFNGSGNSTDKALFIQTDNSGNVYVSGYSTGAGSSYDYATVKYNSAGIQEWSAVYNGQGNAIDYVTSLTTDDSGNVYVTGQSYGGFITQYDIVTIKYNSAGVQQWTSRFDGSGNSNDIGSSLSVDYSGNVIVVGQSFESNSGSYDYIIIKYNSAGEQVRISYYDGPGNGIDVATAVKTDNAGNIFVTGYSRGTSSQYDIATVKYNPEGVEQWVSRHNGAANGNDGATGLVTDNNGNVFVTGYSGISGSNYDIAVLKYDSTGVRQWLRSYTGTSNQNDSSTSIEIDNQGNICVTGFCNNTGTSKDFVTIKYNTNGTQEWLGVYNGNTNGDDVAYSAAFDQNGDVFVTGKTTVPGSTTDIMTLKYSTVSGINSINNIPINGFRLYDNYPNPFNPETNIKFSIPERSFVNLKIFDINGREVAQPVNENLQPGLYEFKFKAVDLPSGVYFYNLKTEEFTETKSMMLIK